MTLSCKYKATAMHLNSAAQCVNSSRSTGPVFVCRETRECCVHVNRWVSHYKDNTQAVSFFAGDGQGRERESAVTSGV